MSGYLRPHLPSCLREFATIDIGRLSLRTSTIRSVTLVSYMSGFFVALDRPLHAASVIHRRYTCTRRGPGGEYRREVTRHCGRASFFILLLLLPFFVSFVFSLLFGEDDGRRQKLAKSQRFERVVRAWSLRLDFLVARMKVEEGFGLDRTRCASLKLWNGGWFVGSTDERRGSLIC